MALGEGEPYQIGKLRLRSSAASVPGHLRSLVLTCAHLHSPVLTCAYLCSPVLTPVHTCAGGDINTSGNT